MRKNGKKLLCALLTLCLMLTVFSPALAGESGAEGPAVYLRGGAAVPGGELELTVETEALRFLNLSLAVGYDENVLTLLEVTNLVSGPTFVGSPSLETQPYALTWTAMEPVSHEGAAAKLRFAVAADAEPGRCAVTLECYRGRDGSAVDGVNVNYAERRSPLGLRYEAEAVTVLTPPPAEGPAVYLRGGAAVPGGEVELTVETEALRFLNLSLAVGYDESVLTLLEVTNLVSGPTFVGSPSLETQPYALTWTAMEPMGHEGAAAKLRFAVAADAEPGRCAVTLDCYRGRDGSAVDGVNVNYAEGRAPLGLRYEAEAVTVLTPPPAEGPAVYLRGGAAVPGGELELTVETEALRFLNLSLAVGYDENVLTLLEVTNLVSGPTFVGSPSLETQPYALTWTAMEPVSHEGAAAKLRFAVAADAGPGRCAVTLECYRGRDGSAVDGVNVNYAEGRSPLGLRYEAEAVTVLTPPPAEETRITVSLGGREVILTAQAAMGGSVLAAGFTDGGRLLGVRIYPAAEQLEAEDMEGAAWVRFMWLDDAFIPLCEAAELRTAAKTD